MTPVKYDYEQVKAMRKEGLSVAKIAAKLGCADSTIYRILKFNGKTNYAQFNRTRLK